MEEYVREWREVVFAIVELAFRSMSFTLPVPRAEPFELGRLMRRRWFVVKGMLRSGPTALPCWLEGSLQFVGHALHSILSQHFILFIVTM